MMATSKNINRYSRNPLLFAKVFLRIELPHYQQELFKKLDGERPKRKTPIPESISKHGKAMAFSLCDNNKPVRGYAVKSFVFDEAAPIDRQCDDCIYNWQYIEGAKPAGHCYLFEKRVANCAQKRRD